MLQDEFNRLMELFQSAAEGKQVNVEEMFKQSLHFFEKLKESMAKGSTEDKMQAIQMMTRMYEQMMAETKRIAQKSGMSEEQLTAFAKNPANFTKEQWEQFQSSQEQIKHIGEDIVDSMQHEADKKEGVPPPHKKSGKEPHTAHKPHKKWLKS